MKTVHFDAEQCKIDNTRMIDFLSSVASAMSECGALDEKIADNLRLVLSGLQAANDRPILLEMMDQEVEFLELLEARFGPATLGMNLLRHTGRPYLQEMLQVLSGWGEKTLGRAKLTFNLPLYIYKDGECQRQQLLATHLVDFGESLAATGAEIEALLTSWETMYPHDMAGQTEEDGKIDQACADALGFAGVMTSQPVSFSESNDLARLAHALDHIAERSTNLISTLNRNTGTGTRYPVLVSSDRLRAACRDLLHHHGTESGSPTTFEVRRLGMIGVFAAITRHLEDLAQMTMDAISRDLPKAEGLKHDEVPKAALRRIAYSLMEQRVEASTAWQATEELFRYLRTQQLAPSQLIESELSKIHPALTPQTLRTLQAIAADATLFHHSSDQKAKNLTQVNKLSKTFARLRDLGPAALALALIFLPGCGVKGPPVSDQLEPRPELPFHAKPLPVEQNSLKEQKSGPNPLNSPKPL